MNYGAKKKTSRKWRRRAFGSSTTQHFTHDNDLLDTCSGRFCGLLEAGLITASQNIFGPSRCKQSSSQKCLHPLENDKKRANKTIASSWWCNSFAPSSVGFLFCGRHFFSSFDDDDKPKLGSRRRVCAHNLIMVRVNSITVNVSLLLHAFYWWFAVKQTRCGGSECRRDTSGLPALNFLLS